MLATDGDPMPDPPGAWGGLVSALQRHTVHGELAQLSKEDRQILSLAYLSGHTNREIAAMLRVSVSTVRRRLSAALARLEESMRRAGTWVSVLALLGLATYGRIAHSVRCAGPAQSLWSPPERQPPSPWVWRWSVPGPWTSSLP